MASIPLCKDCKHHRFVPRPKDDRGGSTYDWHGCVRAFDLVTGDVFVADTWGAAGKDCYAERAWITQEIDMMLCGRQRKFFEPIQPPPGADADSGAQ